MIDNLEYIKVFYYVAKLNSITKAAKELSLSQPAVSQAMKLLEKNLGTRLFYRAYRGIKLTDAGELLYTYVAGGYEQILAGEKQVQRLLNMDLGEIHIGASDMTLKYYLLPFLEKFHEKYPGIKVNVSNAPTPETLKFLQEEKIDFGIVSGPFEVPEGMEAVTVRPVEDIFVAGNRFKEYKDKTLKLHDLEKLPLIFLEKDTSTRSYLDRYLEEMDVKLQPEFELATSDMIVQFALRNLGIGCVVKDFASEYLESGQLFELRFDASIPMRHFCVVKNNNRPDTLAAKRLLEIMEMSMGNQRI